MNAVSSSSKSKHHRRSGIQKLNWQTTFGVVQIQEQILRIRRRGVRLRPFCLRARVKPGGFSQALQRALSDFGAEESFARAAARVKEHYRIEVSINAIRRITYQHARQIERIEPPSPTQPAKVLVTQMDGSMIPLVKPGTREIGAGERAICGAKCVCAVLGLEGDKVIGLKWQ